MESKWIGGKHAGYIQVKQRSFTVIFNTNKAIIKSKTISFSNFKSRDGALNAAKEYKIKM